jgi:pyruvate formate lyase activating enzyme
MKIGAFDKFSLIDYPGYTTAIIFTQGCNFRCPFCHNPELVLPEQFTEPISFGEVYAFLKKRKGILDAVEFTGGEPTLQPDLLDIIKKVKDLGYRVKLDSNGTNPDILEKALNENMVDYIAMDVKGPLEDYSKIAGVNVNTGKIARSINLIKERAPDYEFRTTVLRRFHNKSSFVKIGELVKGARKYYIQNAYFNKVLSPELLNDKVFLREQLQEFCNIVKPMVQHCEVRE